MALERNRNSSFDTRGSNEGWVMSWTSQEVGRLGTEESRLPTRIEVSEEKLPARVLSSWPTSYVNLDMVHFSWAKAWACPEMGRQSRI